MKVIRELIDYFVNSSVLTKEDLRYLEDAGWAQISGACVHVNSDGSIIRIEQSDGGDDDSEDDVGELPEALERPLPFHGRKAKRGPKPRPRGAAANALDQWLASRIGEWRVRWQALEALSSDGARGLRVLSPEEAAGLIRSAIDKRRITWSQLWSALLADDYRAWFGEPEARGHATKAFRELLTAPPALGFPIYRWFLRFPRIAEVTHVAAAQRALLRGISHLLTSDAAWIAEVVHKEKPRRSPHTDTRGKRPVF